MSWPVDETKLARVRRLMAENEVDALVVRAPDNVLYLTNYWCMKGYDIAIFPREGEPTLVAIEPQLADAERNSWTRDIRLFKFYDERDARPPQYRALDLAVDVISQRDLGRRVGIELNMGTQAADRMVAEPTTPTQSYFETFRRTAGEVVDATPLLNQVRALKTPQEIERMRLANQLAALAMDYTREHMRAGMKESEVGAMYEGFVHGHGVGYQDKVEMARAFTLVWSGKGIRTFTATGDRPVQNHEPTLFEIWVCVDGYWTDLTKNACPGELTPAYHRLLDLLLGVFNEATAFARDGASFPDLDRLIRARIREGGYPGQPSHPICHGVGARAHEPPYAHQAGGGTIGKGMVLAIEPGIYWPEGGGLRLEDDFLITGEGNEKLCSYPDDFRLKEKGRV
ncbi:MAG: aminopeptidase P family protein [Acidobacteria bacterium]|nr:aminopeptidase P family protein [Acidobacteriota bacterium]MBV9622668.1 aminopeptidase P family protein [Acidobacteriota bacterium]